MKLQTFPHEQIIRKTETQKVRANLPSVLHVLLTSIRTATLFMTATQPRSPLRLAYGNYSLHKNFPFLAFIPLCFGSFDYSVYLF